MFSNRSELVFSLTSYHFIQTVIVLRKTDCKDPMRSIQFLLGLFIYWRLTDQTVFSNQNANLWHLLINLKYLYLNIFFEIQIGFDWSNKMELSQELMFDCKLNQLLTACVAVERQRVSERKAEGETKTEMMRQTKANGSILLLIVVEPSLIWMLYLLPLTLAYRA